MTIKSVSSGYGGANPVPAPPEKNVKEHRTFDGSGNNIENPNWNKAGETYIRATEVEYSDGKGAIGGESRANPRTISNAVCKQVGEAGDENNLSGFSWVWGQFLDHDLVSTPNGEDRSATIQVPKGDPNFDPYGGGKAIIPVTRSLGKIDAQGVRQQFNNSNSWIDGSMVYGSSKERADSLRSFDGGKLKTSHEGRFLPYNEENKENDDPHKGHPGRLFLAGDARANENLSLTSMHTLFMREHNRLCDEFAEKFPGKSDEEYYQMSRRVVGAQIQAITYNEFLPSLLGESAIPEYQGYDSKVDPRISNLFATAAYRMGHSQVSNVIQRIEENGDEIEQGHLCLRDSYFKPEKIVNEGGISPVLRGLAEYLQEATDSKVVEDLRSFLFGPPGHGGLDLASLNIQRGRDHGIADFNQVRKDFGLEPYKSFEEITKNKDVQDALKSVYSDVNDVDPWIGFLCEDHEKGSSVGPTLVKVLSDQFIRLRDGDRFFFENDQVLKEIAPDVGKTTLSDLIKRNANVENIQENVFLARDPEAEIEPPCGKPGTPPGHGGDHGGGHHGGGDPHHGGGHHHG